MRSTRLREQHQCQVIGGEGRRDEHALDLVSAWSGFEEGSKALMPGIEHGFSQGFSLKKNEEPRNDGPKKDPPKNEQVPENKGGEERTKFKFGSTLGLNKFAKERGGTRTGILAKLKKGEWTKLMEGQKKYEKELGRALDKGKSDPKTLRELAKKCGLLVESCESYIKDKSELLESEEQRDRVVKFEQRKKDLLKQRMGLMGEHQTGE
ncbi:MAG TPA: hypothetical protein PK095_07435 [Myxococcota bacterium]|nr:hypothetical protein [Myxococcota bacterium]